MNRPIRYIVQRPNEPDQGYSCSLGNAQAKSWAVQNASLYGGMVYEEAADGTFELFRDYRDRLPRRPRFQQEGQPEVSQSLEGTPETTQEVV